MLKLAMIMCVLMREFKSQPMKRTHLVGIVLDLCLTTSGSKSSKEKGREYNCPFIDFKSLL